MTTDMFTEVYCSWLAELGDDPHTVAREGFCVNCGATDHIDWHADQAIAKYEAETRIYRWSHEDTE